MTDELRQAPRQGVKILHLGREPKVITLEEAQEVTIADLIRSGSVSGNAASFYLNGRQVERTAIVRNGDGLVAVDDVTAG